MLERMKDSAEESGTSVGVHIPSTDHDTALVDVDLELTMQIRRV